MEFTKEELKRLLTEIENTKSAAVLITELIAKCHRICPDRIQEELIEIRLSIEAEEWAYNRRVEDLKAENIELKEALKLLQ